MYKGKKEGHEVIFNKENKKSSDLYFGLSAIGVNTTKENNNKATRIEEDLELKE